MTTTTTNKSNAKNPTKTNGTGSPDHSEQASASPPTTSPTLTASEKKPVTVMIPEGLHRKVKVLAELSGTSLSDLVEGQLKVVVKERLPGLLAGLDSAE